MEPAKKLPVAAVRKLVRDPKSWAVPPLPKIGDASEDITYRAVGAALSQWELGECFLQEIFSVLVTGKSGSGSRPGRLAAERAYGIISSGRTRLEMLTVATDAYFLTREQPELKKRLVEIIDLHGNYLGRRNDIAHGIVYPHYAKTNKPSYFLFPSNYITRKRTLGGDPKYCYTSVEILKFADCFYYLFWFIDDFWKALHGRRKPTW